MCSSQAQRRDVGDKSLPIGCRRFGPPSIPPRQPPPPPTNFLRDTLTTRRCFLLLDACRRPLLLPGCCCCWLLRPAVGSLFPHPWGAAACRPPPRCHASWLRSLAAASFSSSLVRAARSLVGQHRRCQRAGAPPPPPRAPPERRRASSSRRLEEESFGAVGVCSVAPICGEETCVVSLAVGPGGECEGSPEGMARRGAACTKSTTII